MLTPSGRLRAVTFDCWSTLIYEREPAHSFQLRVHGLTQLLRAAGREPVPAQAQLALQQALRRVGERWMAGQQTQLEQVAQWTLLEFGLAVEPHLSRLCELLSDAQAQDNVSMLDGAVDTLRLLAERGVPMALVCDTGLTPGSRVRQLLDRFGLLRSLEVLVFSDEVGVPKPHAKTFGAALGPLAIAPADAVHVGDLRRTDVAGGRGFGMGTVRIRAHHDDQSELPEADAVAHSHSHLQKLLLRALG